MNILRAFLIALTVCVATVSGQGVALAQAIATETGAPDYEAWDRDAVRADEVLVANRASVEGLQALREQLSSWRDLFTRRQGANSEQIETLEDQIDALGPVPEEGEEAEEIASRRAELNIELEAQTAPVRRAEEAYARADGLISRLDSIVRDRQTTQILELNPTPVNPALWPETVISLASIWEGVVSEVKANFKSPLRAETLKGSLPLIAVLVLIGLALVVRGGLWVERGTSALRGSRHASRARVRVGVFITSLVALVLPIVGMLMLREAIEQSELTGSVGTLVLDVSVIGATICYIARWLGRQIAPPAYPPHPLLVLTQGQALQLRLMINISGLLIGFEVAISGLLGMGLLSETAASVLGLPVIVIAGLFLFRIAQLLVVSAKAQQALATEEAEGSDGTMSAADASAGVVVRYLGRAARLVAVVGPVLAVIGYTFAGNALVFSSYLTLALLAGVAILQRLVRDIYAMIRGEDAGSKGLIPVLVGFALAICSLPILALIWGAQVTDLSEAWAVISAGVPLGESRISPVDFLKFAVVFALGYGLTRLLQSSLKTQILPRTKLDTGGRNAIVSGAGYVGIFLAAVIAITSAGIDLSSLAIVAGALSVGIGFGLQTIVSNFVSGIILLIERPISEGDWIEVGDTMGVVRDISVRATRVETFDRRDVIVPNADLISTSVTNWTKGNLTGRIILPVGVAYGSDTKKVEAVLREIAEAEPLVILSPPPSVLFRGFGADSMDFEIRAVLRDINYSLSVTSNMNHEIARRFAEEGLEIPFAQRDVWLRNPEALSPPQAAPAAPTKAPQKAGPNKPSKKGSTT